MYLSSYHIHLYDVHFLRCAAVFRLEKMKTALAKQKLEKKPITVSQSEVS